MTDLLSKLNRDDSEPGPIGALLGESRIMNVNPAPCGRLGCVLVEWARVVTAAQPDWWLLENVPTVPDLQTVAELSGYAVQRFPLNANECGLSQDRLRHFQFGSRAGLVLSPERKPVSGHSRVCTATEARRGRSRRSWQDFCELQGLPRDFELAGWTQEGAYRAVGNGVPVPMARVVARAVTAAIEGRTPAPLALFGAEYRSSIAESHNVHLRTVTVPGLCRCRCGAALRGKQKYATPACRKRMQRERAGYVRPLSRIKASVDQKQELL